MRLPLRTIVTVQYMLYKHQQKQALFPQISPPLQPPFKPRQSDSRASLAIAQDLTLQSTSSAFDKFTSSLLPPFQYHWKKYFFFDQGYHPVLDSVFCCLPRFITILLTPESSNAPSSLAPLSPAANLYPGVLHANNACRLKTMFSPATSHLSSFSSTFQVFKQQTVFPCFLVSLQLTKVLPSSSAYGNCLCLPPNPMDISQS